MFCARFVGDLPSLRPGFLRGRGPPARRLRTAALRRHAAPGGRRAAELGLRPALVQAHRLFEVRERGKNMGNMWETCGKHMETYMGTWKNMDSWGLVNVRIVGDILNITISSDIKYLEIKDPQ